MQPGQELNEIQVGIMRQLFLRGELRFAQMNVDAVSSDHFSYHLRQLLKYGLVEKTSDGRYGLTVAGKNQAITLAENANRFIEQGLLALRVILSKQEQGQEYFLVQERTKVPFRGKLAAPGGKVLFGENIEAAAARALQHETGLSADLYLRGLVHYMGRYQSSTVQDTYFFVLHAANPTGELTPSGPTGKNRWLTLEELRQSPQTHQGLLHMITIAQSEAFAFTEQTFITETY